MRPFAAIAIPTIVTVVGTVGRLPAQAARRSAPSTSPPEAAEAADAPSRARQGMWLSAGLGAGAVSLKCRLCTEDQETRGTAAYLRVGTTINPHFLVGAEANGWLRSDEGGSHRVIALTGNAYWYPNPRHAWYLKGGFGITRYRTAQQEEGVVDALTAGGFAGQLGAGYEVRVNPRMSVVPYLNLIGSANGTLSLEHDDGSRFERNRLARDANVLMLQLGLGITWH